MGLFRYLAAGSEPAAALNSGRDTTCMRCEHPMWHSTSRTSWWGWLFQPLTSTFLKNIKCFLWWKTAEFGMCTETQPEGLHPHTHRQISSAYLVLVFIKEKMSWHGQQHLVLWTKETPGLCFLLTFELSSKGNLIFFFFFLAACQSRSLWFPGLQKVTNHLLSLWYSELHVYTPNKTCISMLDSVHHCYAEKTLLLSVILCAEVQKVLVGTKKAAMVLLLLFYLIDNSPW